METSEFNGYEQHFTAFIDLLGFAEASTGGDEITRTGVLAFLLSIASVRGEYDFQSRAVENGTTILIKPTISTFSDHIVISYPLKRIAASLKADDSDVAMHVLLGFSRMVDRIAASALSIGFLIRGGATIGNLYHSSGIAFGDAMVEAYRLESKTAIYPRIVLSHKVSTHAAWMKWGKVNLRRGSDGLYYFNYYRNLVFNSGPPGNDAIDRMKAWFARLTQLIADNLSKLEKGSNMAGFSKWAWFANELYSTMQDIPLDTRTALGIDIETIPKIVFTVPTTTQQRE